MDIALTGSHGFIASHLMPALRDRGHNVLRVVRSEAESQAPDALFWDPDHGRIDAGGLEGIGGVVHLAGAGIGDRRWTEARKKLILESRTKSTALLATTLAGLQKPPQVLISASAIGYYGERGDDVITEQTPAGRGFVADVCVRWEGAAAPATEAGIRVVTPRSGIVLGRSGGALKRLLIPFRLGVGGRLGSGRQWFSWIAVDDEVRSLLYLLEGSELSGAVNSTSPHPVTNADFTTTLGRILRRPTVVPAPTIALKAVFGREAVEEALLASQRVLPARLQNSGFTFTLPDLESALRAILRRPARQPPDA